MRITMIVVLLVTLAGPCAARDGSKIGFVNLRECFNRYKKAETFEDEINNFMARKNEELESMGAELEQLSEELEILNKDSKIRREKERRFIMLRSNFEYAKQQLKMDLRARLITNTLEIYREIRAVVDEIGEEGGFDVIFKVEEGDLEDVDSAEEVRKQINHRPVLYHNPELEITNKVVEALNKRFDVELGGEDGGGEEPKGPEDK